MSRVRVSSSAEEQTLDNTSGEGPLHMPGD